MRSLRCPPPALRRVAEGCPDVQDSAEGEFAALTLRRRECDTIRINRRATGERTGERGMNTPRIRAIVFDAGHTLLEMDYARVTEYLRARGHEVAEPAVVAAERGARMRLDVEQAAQPTRTRTGQGRYVRFLLDALSIDNDDERRAVAEWRRGFNVPIGLCHRADPEAARALQRAREAGLA